MSRIARRYSESGIYHIMFRGVNQQNIFEEPSDYRKLAHTIAKIKSEMGFEVYAYCFMDNHVHIVIKEKNEKDISLIMKRILTTYARWYNIKYNRSGALIANRYKSIPVECDEYFLQLVRYIHQNPLKAGMVEKLNDYPYSSYIEYIGSGTVTDKEFVLSMLPLGEFEDFHGEIGDMEFVVTESNKKTDDDIVLFLRKNYDISEPPVVAELPDEQRNLIIAELKKHFKARHIQRMTGVSRYLIGKTK